MPADPLDASRSDVGRLVDIAVRGLPTMYLPTSQSFVQTVRGTASPSGPRVVGQGDNLRYAAIAALGLTRSSDPAQRRVLAGSTAAQLSAAVSQRARVSPDHGAVALAAWAAAECENRCEAELFARLERYLASDQPLSTVVVAWILTAAVSARFTGDTTDLAKRARDLLVSHQSHEGIFPHALPAKSLGRWRAHVGCFADQVYPIQALARYAAATADADSLTSANRCGARICDLQGEGGQWWWHYDVTHGTVVEGYPVYSVHQHAMAPMALLDLFEAGGDDYREAVRLGVNWLFTHPEVLGELVDPSLSVVWRKVGRREPPKAARKVSAVTTALRPGFRMPALDRLLPATVIDYECRPYEFGWLLYAWQRPDQRLPTAPSVELHLEQ